jgi:hypothetical protein
LKVRLSCFTRVNHDSEEMNGAKRPRTERISPLQPMVLHPSFLV